jgi:hypothetical protein
LDTRELYLRILRIADEFVKAADSVQLSIPDLTDLDPSVTKIAKHIRQVAHILNSIAVDGDDEEMAMNAFQCCWVMERIADAIQENDELSLQRFVRSLEMHACAPIPPVREGATV